MARSLPTIKFKKASLFAVNSVSKKHCRCAQCGVLIEAGIACEEHTLSVRRVVDENPDCWPDGWWGFWSVDEAGLWHNGFLDLPKSVRDRMIYAKERLDADN